jgi:predicted amidophosphoribosyltransferase
MFDLFLFFVFVVVTRCFFVWLVFRSEADGFLLCEGCGFAYDGADGFCPKCRYNGVVGCKEVVL